MKKVLLLSFCAAAAVMFTSCSEDTEEKVQCEVSQCQSPENATAKCEDNACSFECNEGYEKEGDSCKIKEQGTLCDPQKCTAPENSTAKCVNDACSFECNEGYEKDGDVCKAKQQEIQCDPAITDDVYSCQGKWRVVCKNGESWVDNSGQNLGTFDCSKNNQVCHEQKSSEGVVFDAYCTVCDEKDLTNCTVTNPETMTPICADNGIEGMICDFECKSGYQKNEAGDACEKQ